MAESKGLNFGTSLSSDSHERWAKHAIGKLSKGYNLIISKTRVSANFYMPGSGFATCPHKTAVKLVRAGYLQEIGEHDLGTIYALKPEYVNAADLKKKVSRSSKKDKPTLASSKDPDQDDDLLDDDALDDDMLEDDDLDDETLEDDDLDDETSEDDDLDDEDL